MWVYIPQKWWEVPGWLWHAWTARPPAARGEPARPTETSPRPATVQPWGTPRPAIAESVDRIRTQVEKMRPEKCCKGEVMIAGGRRHDVCSEDCPWQELDLLVANASVDASTT